MHYQRLDLDDFGVFQGARLDDLDTGLIVIAGPQRAGKTTFMEALRRLGYGIGQGDAVPPERDTYRLDAQLVHDDAAYRLRVDGYADPSLTPLDHAADDGQLPAVDDVFGGLSREQYRQLYTLSLYQLQRLPPSIEDPEDLSRVLLGAAYGSIADLPDVKQHFHDKAIAIGGKRGHPRYKQFSDAYERIQEGEKELQEANTQVERHNEKQEELEEVEERLAEITAAKQDLDAERQRLTTVQQYFDEFHTYRQLGEAIAAVDEDRVAAYPDNGLERAKALREEFRAAHDEVEEARTAFRTECSAEDPESRREVLLDIEDSIEAYQSEVSGWRERLHTVHGTADELADRRRTLESRVVRLRDDWGENLTAVTSVETDLVNRDTVEQAVTSVTDTRETVGELESELAGKRERRTELESQLQATDTEAESQLALLGVAGAGLLGVFTAIGLAGLVSPLIGVVVGAVLILLGTAIAIYLGGSGTGGSSQRTQLTAQLNAVEQDIAALEERHEQATTALDAAESDLESVRQTLGVAGGLSPDGVLDFYEAVDELQADIDEYEADVERNEERREALEEELRDVAATVQRVQSFGWDETEPLEHADALFTAVERAAGTSELAAEWDAALSARRAVYEDITEFFEDWTSQEMNPDELNGGDVQAIDAALGDAIVEGEVLADYEDGLEDRADIRQNIRARFRIDAVREAFTATYDPPVDASLDEWCLDAFEAIANQYADASEIERRLNDIDSREADLESERDERREERAELKQALSQLASEDDLIAARRKIQTGEQTIERLAEDYGRYRVAEYITEELQDQFIEETTGPLLDEASEIFAHITNEYDGVEHTRELADLDFRVIQDGTPVLESAELSRATAEQLFMAVRMARIRQNDASLPVVLDDALTNFDPAHSARTMRLIDELASTNQVFFLTAHPAYVTLAAEYADVDQFWRVDDGEFTGPFTDSDAATTGLQPDSISRPVQD